MKSGCVYLMANHRRGQTYLGVTSNLPQRVWQHRNGVVEGHSKDKGCKLLVWYEYYDDLQEARACERRMKKWRRPWKLRVIEERNPEWRDLFAEICARGRSSGLHRSTEVLRIVLRRRPERWMERNEVRSRLSDGGPATGRNPDAGCEWRPTLRPSPEH